MGLHDQKIDGVPQFVSYFVPVIEIMRDMGGQGRSPGKPWRLGALKTRVEGRSSPTMVTGKFRTEKVKPSPDLDENDANRMTLLPKCQTIEFFGHSGEI